MIIKYKQMAKKPSEVLKQVKQRSYLAKDFDSLRQQILGYAKTYFPEKNSDFSENSLGGLLLEMAAYVGDNLSFYLDHQFNELDIESAVETRNVLNLLKKNGVKAFGASPATVSCTFYIEVPAVVGNNSFGRVTYVPSEECLPVLRQGTVVTSEDGIDFRLTENIDFSEKDTNGDYVATITTGQISGETVKTMILSRDGFCISGKEKTFNFSVGGFIPYRKISLPDQNIYQIISVTDSLGNIYYEVNDLTEDSVYKSNSNISYDSKVVRNTLQMIPAPYRFTKEYDITSGITTLTFGGGNALSLDDDVIPDPSKFAIPLPNVETFSRTSLNPQTLLSTRTLGAATENSTFTVVYRYGGGLSNNVQEKTINGITNLKMFFPKSPAPQIAQAITNNTEVLNLVPASGGEDAPSIDDLKVLATAIRNSQERIVTKEDLIARVYTLPPQYGRVFRAAVRENIENPLSTKLFVVSRDPDGKLTQSSDTLKLNLSKYLNSYRLISDAIDILDSPIVNFKLRYSVVLDPQYNSEQIIQTINTEIINYFDTKKCQIDKPIYISEVVNTIFSVNGVISMPQCDSIIFENLYGNIDNKPYSSFSYNLEKATLKQKGIIVPPEGGIFEIKYPDINIIGKSV